MVATAGFLGGLTAGGALLAGAACARTSCCRRRSAGNGPDQEVR
jgi:hypothetical protein